MTTRTCMLVIGLLTSSALAAGHDDNVEWNGITHIDWLERNPICPVDGESFTITFQTYRYDITSASVWVNDSGLGWTEVPAAFLEVRAAYDVWIATIPPSTSTGSVEYYIALTDGSETDYLGPQGMSSDPPAVSWYLDMVTASHAPVGATLTSDGGAVFKVWVEPPSWYPTGDWISVRGDFNGWACTELDRDGNYWVGRVLGDGLGFPRIADEGDGYKYYFWDSGCGSNSWDWHEDARYRAVDRYSSNNSMLLDPNSYVWTNKHMSPPPFEEMVIYEMHVGTFSGLNDDLGDRSGLYRDVVDRHLDHLKYIGVNVVELMPISEFDGYESWGYNPINNWAPEEAYGSPEDLKHMINGLHRAGIAVVLDVVYNHFSTGGNYVWDYGDTTYFDRNGDGSPGCDTQWGAQAAFWKQDVQDYYTDNALYWIEEYGVDGFRMDATRFMRAGDGNGGCYEQGVTIMQKFNDNINRRKVGAISIAEELPNSSWIVDSAGFDAQWHDPFNDDVRNAIFAAGQGGDPNIQAVADAIAGWGYDNAKLVRYVESHDEAGGDGDGDHDRRLAVSIDYFDHYSHKAKSITKLAQGLTFMTAGIPMFLQGGEWAEDIKFDGGWGNRIDWAKAVSRPEMTLFFRDAIGIRRAECALRADAASNVYEINDAGDVVAFRRGTGEEIVVIANFSATNYGSYGISFPKNGTWYEILNSQASAYGGNGWGNGGSVWVDGYYANIVIPQWSILVLRHENPRGRSSDLDYDGDVDLKDYAILQQAVGDAGCGMAYDIDENGRIDDGDAASMAQNMTGPNSATK